MILHADNPGLLPQDRKQKEDNKNPIQEAVSQIRWKARTSAHGWPLTLHACYACVHTLGVCATHMDYKKKTVLWTVTLLSPRLSWALVLCGLSVHFPLIESPEPPLVCHLYRHGTELGEFS